jgi:RimJ/RimL family protein N-acetyltransferase
VNDESEGVWLRALTRSDAEAIVAGDRTGRTWASDYPTPGDEFIAKGALEGVVAFVTPSMPWGLYAIVERRGGRIVGGIGFKASPNERGEVEIGYGVCTSCQGRGVATDAVRAMCDLARPGATAVLAETDLENVASQRVLTKAGFQVYDGTDDLLRWRRIVDCRET